MWYLMVIWNLAWGWRPKKHHQHTWWVLRGIMRYSSMMHGQGVKGTTLKRTGEFMLYHLQAISTWTHDVYTYSHRRRVQLMRVVVTTRLLCMLIVAVCHMMHGRDLPGGAHHMHGGHQPLDPRRDVHHKIPPV